MRISHTLMGGIVFLMSLPLTAQTPPAKRVVDNVVPGAQWQTVTPESVGYSNANSCWTAASGTGRRSSPATGRVSAPTAIRPSDINLTGFRSYG
jgi:hypothetical protein